MSQLDLYKVKRNDVFCYSPHSVNLAGRFIGGIPSKINSGLGGHTCDLQYEIHSPSVEQGVRRYVLNYSSYIGGQSEVRDDEYFAGLVAEQIMRITAKEFIRRISGTVGLTSYDFLKKNGVTYESNDFHSEFISRHNLEVYDSRSRRVLSEYDGLLEYTLPGEKGLFVCESKTGSLDHLACANSAQKGLVTRRIIEPISQFFPQHSHAVLLMAPVHTLYSSKQKQRLHKSIGQLHDHLAQHNFELFVLPFSQTRTDFLSVGKQINSLRKNFSVDVPKILSSKSPSPLSLVQSNLRTRYVIDTSAGSILEIQELVSDDLWKTIFKKRRKVL
jgi:hypothetical protein